MIDQTLRRGQYLDRRVLGAALRFEDEKKKKERGTVLLIILLAAHQSIGTAGCEHLDLRIHRSSLRAMLNLAEEVLGKLSSDDALAPAINNDHTNLRRIKRRCSHSASMEWKRLWWKRRAFKSPRASAARRQHMR